MSNSQTLILDGVGTGILLLDLAQQLRRKNAEIPDFYFTLLDASGKSPTLILNQNAKAEERGNWVLFENLNVRNCKGCTQRVVLLMGPCSNLVKANNLSVSKVRQFLHSKPSYKKFTLATRKFKRRKAFARFENEICCLDLAYVEKMAKDNNGVKYLMIRQDLFDRTVDGKGMKTKDSKETVKTFSKMITEKDRPQKFWVDDWTEFAGEFKMFCSAEGIEIYYTMSETKAAFAERTIRSLKNILYRYMEDYAYKYTHNLPQFIAIMNSRNNRSIDMKPNHVKNSDFLWILYSKPLREYQKPKFGFGDRIRISKYDSPFRKGYKPQFTQEIFESVAIATKKPPTYTITDEPEEVIRGKFYEKELIRVI